MKTIPLSKNKHAIVDDEDFEWLSKLKWHSTTDSKSRTAYTLNKKVRMHKEIAIRHGLVSDRGQLLDHIDGNGLNNQKSNLRLATISQNQANKTKYKNNTSGYKGVDLIKNRWRACIQINKKQTYLGLFKTPTEAAAAYNNKAIELYGEYARINVL